ncbi:hypothetical protein Tco_0725316 [Tanacetum coccineum]|uniref:Uncharacterized protein n=1 Tax=Tanacetum coccineum TaxID=301880 RepID=A0ABQ4YCJ8_9ASTR
MSIQSIRCMVWSGYAVLISGKTDSITKLNNIPGCLPGSTFVYSEVFKLDFSSASISLQLMHANVPACEPFFHLCISNCSILVDTAYWVDPIRRIECESASMVVEIDLTWSLGFVSVELGRLPNPLSYRTLLICPICISNVLIDAHWFLMAASIEARISLIKLEFSSCFFADSLMNFLRVSSIDCHNTLELLLYILLLEKVYQIACSKLLLGFSPSSFVEILLMGSFALFASNLSCINFFIHLLDLPPRCFKLCLYRQAKPFMGGGMGSSLSTSSSRCSIVPFLRVFCYFLDGLFSIFSSHG